MTIVSRRFSAKTLLITVWNSRSLCSKRVVLHREEARKTSKEVLTTYFGVILQSARAKKIISSSIPDILLETNHWNFHIQFSRMWSLPFHRAHRFCPRWETDTEGYIKHYTLSLQSAASFTLSTPQHTSSSNCAKPSYIFSFSLPASKEFWPV